MTTLMYGEVVTKETMIQLASYLQNLSIISYFHFLFPFLPFFIFFFLNESISHVSYSLSSLQG